MGGTILRDEDVFPHILYIAMYMLILALSVMLALFIGVRPPCALAGSLCSLGNVGPAVAEIGLVGNFNGIPDAGKLVFALDMFLGRIEIYPILAVLAMIFSRKSNY